MDIFEFISEAIEELVDVDFDLTPDVGVDSLELASLDYIELQVMVKKTFGVVVEADLFESGQLRTLGDFCHYIESNK